MLICAVCLNGFYLWGGRCLASCPPAHFASRQSVDDADVVISETCSPCHYSCMSCSGAGDSECITCHADAQLRSVITNQGSAGSKASMEVYCQPTSLVKQLASYERWALAIELFLGVNAAVVCALLAYMMCQGSAGSLGSFCSSSWRWRSRSSSYHSFNPVNSRDKTDGVIDVDDSTSLLSDDQM